MVHERRTFLKQLGGLTLATSIVPMFDPLFSEDIEVASRRIADLSPGEAARDEAFWEVVRKAFSMSGDFINLENGFYSPQPTGVMEAQIRNIRMINEISTYYMRKRQDDDKLRVRKELAEFAGCAVEEMVVCRNTTEALDTIISGLDLREGDEAVMTNQDYGSMLQAFAQQSKRFRITNRIISLPLHPKDKREIVKAFEDAITPRTRVLLLTHMINLTGQVLPAREICDMAHERGVEVVVDAAHSLAHIDFSISDLHCDYLGASLHKWLCAPLGTGLLYVKREKIDKVWPLFGDTDFPADDIRKFEHIGTHPRYSDLTILNAIKFHNSIGSKRKEERLRYLKNYWAEQVQAFPKVTLNTPLHPDLSCAIGNFAIEGRTPAEIADYLFEKHKVFTVAIDTEAVKGVRVTPHLYNTLEELDVLVQGIKELCFA